MIGNENLISIDPRRCLPASGGILVTACPPGGIVVDLDPRHCLPASGGIIVLILVNDQDADGERQRSLQRRAGRDEDFRNEDRDEDFRNEDQDDDQDEERLPNHLFTECLRCDIRFEIETSTIICCETGGE